MRAYGHLHGLEESRETFLELQSAVIEVEEPFLVALCDFAQYALDDMRRLGKDCDHVHASADMPKTNARCGANRGRISS